jgi:hypothetical protein
MALTNRSVSDLTEAEVRSLLEKIVLGIREDRAMRASEIYVSIRETLEEAGLDLSEIEL